MNWLAFDIGGANIKVADGLGYADSIPFPLWKQPVQLADEISRWLQVAPCSEQIVITMTGELADCFATKTEGVATILSAAEQAAGNRPVWIYLTDGRLVSLAVAKRQPLRAAASNWHALASFAVRYFDWEPALLLDCGSTTSDLIPLDAGGPVTVGLTDPERLVASELVYTGVIRSPVCAVVSHLTWHGERCPVAQEIFATTVDAYLTLGDLAEDAENFDTADGRARTKVAAQARLARMVCADSTEVSISETAQMAADIRDAQLQLLAAAYVQVTSRMERPPVGVITSGAGEFLLRRLLDAVDRPGKRVSLAEELGETVSRAATAHALAVLARERLPA